MKQVLRWIKDRWVKKEPCVCLTDGRQIPEDQSHVALKPNGQQRDYVVLCDEERKKGFVRPVRDTYRHVGKRPKYQIRELSEEEKARYAACGYVAFEDYPPELAPKIGRFWTSADLNSGCETVTTMGRALAETYAREPGFYGGTFCCHCHAHFPVGADGEFVWEDGSRVGT